MRRCGSHLLVGIAAMLTLLAAPCVARPGGLAQERVSPEERVEAAARATMQAAKYCFLTTLDGSGDAQARLMDPFAPEPNMTVWMGTNRTTRKVAQLRKNPRATLAYYDAAGVGYVTLIGKARLVDDLNERRKRWKPEWQPFYPDGPTGSTYILIEFTPTRIEVMSFQHQIASEPLAWRPAILLRKGSAWTLEK